MKSRAAKVKMIEATGDAFRLLLLLALFTGRLLTVFFIINVLYDIPNIFDIINLCKIK